MSCYYIFRPPEFRPMRSTMIITRLFFSLSFLSFVFSCTSLWYTSSNWVFLHLEGFYNSNKCLSLLRAAMNKNCWFLVFNGLLVILAKTSGFAPSSPPKGFEAVDDCVELVSDKFESRHAYDSFFEKDRVVVMETERSCGVELLERKDFECEDQVVIIERCDVKLQVQIYDDKQDDNYDGDHDDHNYDGDHEDDNEDYDGMMDEDGDETNKLSNEELNKKFEEFIRRIKEEIRIDEIQHQRQQQLIAVN